MVDSFLPQEQFLARKDEQAKFRSALRQVLKSFKPSSTLEVIKPVSTRPAEQPFIFLLYGLGGMGKSSLGRRFIEIAEGKISTDDKKDFAGKFHCLHLDWEEQKTRAVESQYSLTVHEDINFEALFYHIYAFFRENGFGHHFDHFENTLSQRKAVENKVVSLIRGIGLDPQNRYAPLAKLGGKILTVLVRKVPVAGELLDKEQTEQALASVIERGAKGLAKTRELAAEWLNEYLSPEERDLFQQPHERLAFDLARGLRTVTRRKPLLLLLDTYEIADRADPFLRLVIKLTGSNIIWVISGRRNLADTQHYGRGSILGYKEEFHTKNLHSMLVMEFNITDVATYLRGAVPHRRSELTPEVVEAIHNATMGIPLAVKEAAAIWATNKPLTAVTGKGPTNPDHARLAQLMTHRFFIHCTSEKDRQLLYALALAHQPTPNLLSAMLDTPDLTAILEHLARQYTFVLATERQLHEVVRTYTLKKLLNDRDYQLPTVQVLNERTVAYLSAEQARLAERCSNLKACFEDERWTATTVSLIYHSFWWEEDTGWDSLLPTLTGALYYDLNFAKQIMTEIEPLAKYLIQRHNRYNKITSALSTLVDEQQKAWSLQELQETSVSYTDEFYREIDVILSTPFDDQQQVASLLRELKKTRTFWPKDKFDTERSIILELVQGQYQLRLKNYATALQTVEPLVQKIEQMFPHLQKQVAEYLRVLSVQLMWPDSISNVIFSETAHKALEIATSLAADDPSILGILGLSYLISGKYDEAIQTFQRAIQLDEKSVYFHNGLGFACVELDKIDEAIKAFQQAVKLDRNHPGPHYGLGLIYYDLKQTNEAIQAFKRAIHLYQEEADFHYKLGLCYYDLGQTNEAIQAFKEAIQLDEKHAGAYIFLGITYQDLDKTDQAIHAFQQAIRIDKKRASPHFFLGTVYQKLGETNKAIQSYQRAIQLDKQDAHTHKRLGDVYHDLGKTDKAIQSYQQAIELDPTLASPHHYLGNIYRDLKKTDEAIRSFQRAIELNEQDAYAYIGLGTVYQYMGKTDEAVQAYQQAIELDDSYAAPHINLGTIYHALDKTEEAIHAYQRAIDLDKKSAMPYYNLGLICYSQGKIEEAIQYYQQAIELDDKDVDSRINIGVIYRSQGKINEALQALRHAIQLNKNYAVAHNELGNTFYYGLKESEKAVQSYLRAMELDENWAIPHYNLGKAYRSLGKTDEAIQAYQRAIELNEKYASAHNELGNIFYYDLGKPDEAIPHYQRAIEVDENSAYPHYNLGRIYRSQGKTEEAIQSYQRAIELNEKYAAAHNELGNIFYYDLDKPDEAILHYQRAIEVDENYAYPHYNLGGIYRSLGKTDEAIQAYQRAIELDENYAAAYTWLGNIYYDLDKPDEAILHYHRAIEVDENSAYPHYNLGVIYHSQGKTDEAIQAYQRAIELNENYAAAYNQLGNVYCSLGRIEETIRAYEQTIELNEKDAAPNYNNLGDIYHSLGKFNEAIQAYKRAIELNEKDAHSYNGLGNVYHALDKTDEAIAAYQKAIELNPKSGYIYNNLASVYQVLGQLDKATDFYRKRIELSPENAMNAHINLGLIAIFQGKDNEAMEQFNLGLDIWETAWRKQIQSPAGLLEIKALALLGLGQLEASISTLKESLARRLPGDTIELKSYDFLASAPNPPSGLAEIRRLLEAALETTKTYEESKF